METYLYYKDKYGIGNHEVNGQFLNINYESVVWYIKKPNQHYAYFCAHRNNGPAAICENGYTAWYANGSNIQVKLSKWAKENNIDLYDLSEDDKQLIKLIWFT